jgi:16S rRNA G966 N2-methylase RsmD
MSKNTASQLEQIKTADLVPYARNAKKHDEAQVAKLAGSIREFGFNNPVLIDADNGIIAGHGRVMAAQKLALASVPCLRLSHLSETQKRAYILADNRLAELGGGWDAEMLKLELADLGDLDVDLDGIGFGADDLEDLELSEEPETSDVDAEPQIDKAEELRAKWGVEPGQLWELGDHRLLCGDSTKKEDVDRVMRGDVIDMVFTDPPYGISHSGKGITANGVKGNDFGEIIGDGDIEVATKSFTVAEQVFPAATKIFWGANYYPQVLPIGHGWIVWDKEREGDTFSGAELAFVNGGVKVRVFRHMWHGMVKASEHGQKRVHPTQKPVALAIWCFENYGNPKTVIDFFSGSGTTIIACEQLGRKCRAIEISPAYVAVALQRWADATGKTPKLVA